MTKVVTFDGNEYAVSDAATFFVFVPDGETEAHVFINGRFIGKRSDFEGGALQSMMQNAEDAAKVSGGVSILHARVQALEAQILALSVSIESRVMQVMRKGNHRGLR